MSEEDISEEPTVLATSTIIDRRVDTFFPARKRLNKRWDAKVIEYPDGKLELQAMLIPIEGKGSVTTEKPFIEKVEIDQGRLNYLIGETDDFEFE